MRRTFTVSSNRTIHAVVGGVVGEAIGFLAHACGGCCRPQDGTIHDLEPPPARQVRVEEAESPPNMAPPQESGGGESQPVLAGTPCAAEIGHAAHAEPATNVRPDGTLGLSRFRSNRHEYDDRVDLEKAIKQKEKDIGPVANAALQYVESL
eukprot:4240364-Prymnesium_polylepis.1